MKLDEELLELEGIEEVRKEWGYYQYEELGIPRVTNIISQCEDKSGLVQWAATIGRRKYDFYRDRALNIGTIVHEIIDDYLLYHKGDRNYKIRYDHPLYEPEYKDQIDTAFSNFLIWEDNLYKRGVTDFEVLGVEIPVSCPWYGGTIDAIFRINGKYLIIDFKTSKSLSMNYVIQTVAYRWCINNGYVKNLPYINGVGIIRVDKNSVKLDDLFLCESDSYQLQVLSQYEQCFMSYVNMYYYTKSSEYVYDKYYNYYNPLKYEV